MLPASPTMIRHRLALNMRVGEHLRIRSVLGQGATAVVYEAVDTRLGTALAVKVADTDSQDTRGAFEQLTHEARICELIDDPRVAKIYQVGALNDGRPYLIMERVLGCTLEALLARGPVELLVALDLTRDLLMALAAVHRAGVVHRDIKPANVIVRFDRNRGAHVGLIDFGVSEAAAPGHDRSPSVDGGALLGTPLYMAPEQISDEAVDARTDVYAVGVLLYEMLAGRVPFGGRSTAEAMAAVWRHECIPLADACPGIPAPLVSLVTRALSAAPADRFSSALEMRDLLDTVWHDLRRPVGCRGRVRASRAPGAWTVRAAAVAALAVLACGLSGGSSEGDYLTVARVRSPLALAASKPGAKDSEATAEPARGCPVAGTRDHGARSAARGLAP